MKLIDFNQLAPRKGITYSRDHLRRRCKNGEFPEPIKVSDRRIAWIEAEVDAWLARRTAERDGVAEPQKLRRGRYHDTEEAALAIPVAPRE